MINSPNASHSARLSMFASIISQTNTWGMILEAIHDSCRLPLASQYVKNFVIFMRENIGIDSIVYRIECEGTRKNRRIRVSAEVSETECLSKYNGAKRGMARAIVSNARKTKFRYQLVPLGLLLRRSSYTARFSRHSPFPATT